MQINVGSRESPLALVQTRLVMGLLEKAQPNVVLGLQTLKTQGDKFLDAPLAAIGDKGLFVKELEEGLLAGQIDLAIHSLKDMLAILPDGLAMQSITPREDVRDALLNLHQKTLRDLPEGAVVGTASLRRVAQLKRLRPDLRYEMVRGNLQTRFKKLESGQYDALILAAAGIKRMGWLADPQMQSSVTQFFEPGEILPAVGQGILGVEYRTGHTELQSILDQLTDANTELSMTAERAFLKQLEGGCRLPVAAYAHAISSETFHIKGAVFSADGTQAIEQEMTFAANKEAAENAGITLAADLLARGAKDILAAG